MDQLNEWCSKWMTKLKSPGKTSNALYLEKRRQYPPNQIRQQHIATTRRNQVSRPNVPEGASMDLAHRRDRREDESKSGRIAESKNPRDFCQQLDEAIQGAYQTAHGFLHDSLGKISTSLLQNLSITC